MSRGAEQFQVSSLLFFRSEGAEAFRRTRTQNELSGAAPLNNGVGNSSKEAIPKVITISNHTLDTARTSTDKSINSGARNLKRSSQYT
jgi:hypothetical protein